MLGWTVHSTEIGTSALYYCDKNKKKIKESKYNKKNPCDIQSYLNDVFIISFYIHFFVVLITVLFGTMQTHTHNNNIHILEHNKETSRILIPQVHNFFFLFLSQAIHADDTHSRARAHLAHNLLFKTFDISVCECVLKEFNEINVVK